MINRLLQLQKKSILIICIVISMLGIGGYIAARKFLGEKLTENNSTVKEGKEAVISTSSDVSAASIETAKLCAKANCLLQKIKEESKPKFDNAADNISELAIEAKLMIQKVSIFFGALILEPFIVVWLSPPPDKNPHNRRWVAFMVSCMISAAGDWLLSTMRCQPKSGSQKPSHPQALGCESSPCGAT